MTVSRYIGVVALVYVLALSFCVAYASQFDLHAALNVQRVWLLPVGAVVLAVLGTLAPIARFGNAGGSIYALPTAIHLFLLLSLAIVIIAAWP